MVDIISRILEALWLEFRSRWMIAKCNIFHEHKKVDGLVYKNQQNYSCKNCGRQIWKTTI